MMSESIFANQILQSYVDSKGNTEKYEEILAKLGQIIPDDVISQPIFKTILTTFIAIVSDEQLESNPYSIYTSLIVNVSQYIVSRRDRRELFILLTHMNEHFSKYELSFANTDENAEHRLSERFTELTEQIHTIPTFQEHTLFFNEYNKIDVPALFGEKEDILISNNYHSQTWIIFLLKLASRPKFIERAKVLFRRAQDL